MNRKCVTVTKTAAEKKLTHHFGIVINIQNQYVKLPADLMSRHFG